METQNPRKTIAIGLPGERFTSTWMASFVMLFGELFSRFNVVPVFGYSTNVYATRSRILQAMVEMDETQLPIDYALWLDDDNTLTWPQLELLLQDLDDTPHLNAVAGWCWVAPDSYAISAIPSCGMFRNPATNHKTIPLDLKYLGTVNGEPPSGPDLVYVDYTGFPAVLFKFDDLRLLAPLRPFSPYAAEELELGFMGEDTGFWMRARHAGMLLAVDRRVKVPHYKLRDAEPSFTTSEQVSIID